MNDIPKIPDHVSAEVRALWPVVVSDLLQSGVKLRATDFMILEMFCNSLCLLRDCRRGLTLGVMLKAPDGTSYPNPFVETEKQILSRVHEAAADLLIPDDVLQRYLDEPPPLIQ